MEQKIVDRYNLYNLEHIFKTYLTAVKAFSKSTVKNYLSDFRHFCGWLNSIAYSSNLNNNGGQQQSDLIEQSELKNGENSRPENISSYIDSLLIDHYKSYLISSKLPLKTINRRLSTLRQFCSFCISQGWMSENPAKKIRNISKIGLISPMGPISPILTKFSTSLSSLGLPRATIDQTARDINEFLEITSFGLSDQ